MVPSARDLAVIRRVSICGRGGLKRNIGCRRKLNAAGRSFADLRLYLQSAAIEFDGAQGKRQAEPAPAPLGGEIQIQNLVENLWRYADALIGNVDFDHPVLFRG